MVKTNNFFQKLKKCENLQKIHNKVANKMGLQNFYTGLKKSGIWMVSDHLFQVTIQPVFDHLSSILAPLHLFIKFGIKTLFCNPKMLRGGSCPRAALGLALIFKRLIAGKGWHVWAGIKNIYHNSSGCRSKYLLWIKHVEQVSNVCHGRFDFVLEELDVSH